MKQILFLLFPGIELLDFAGPLQTFVEAESRGCDLTLSYCSWQTEICASQRIFINRLEHFSRVSLREGDIIVIPGMDHQCYTGNSLSRIPGEVFVWLKKAYENRVQLCSICTGAFVLAHAGLLDGKPGLSPRNLTRLFKKATSITIKQYTTLVTLEHARQLFKDRNTPIKPIALQCGFHDAKHLRRLCKKHFGTTPSRDRTT